MGPCSLALLTPPNFPCPALVFTLLPPFIPIRDLRELWLSMVPAVPRGEACGCCPFQGPARPSTFDGSSRGEPDPGTEHVLAQGFILGGAHTHHGFCLEHGTSVCTHVVRGQFTFTLELVRVSIHPTDIPGSEEA